MGDVGVILGQRIHLLYLGGFIISGTSVYPDLGLVMSRSVFFGLYLIYVAHFPFLKLGIGVKP